MHATSSQLADLRRANDILRTTLLTGNVMWKAALAALDPALQNALLVQMRVNPEFDPVRDPGSEHAAGRARSGEHVLTWQVLYYDGRMPGFHGRSPDPANPHVTRRVLLLDYVHEPD